MADARSMAILSPEASRNIAGTDALAGVVCNLRLNDALESDGFKSPDTYGSYFAAPTDGPAVYIFTLVDVHTFRRGIVAYVGMSIKLSQRWIGHPVLAGFTDPRLHVKRWFRPTHKVDLRRIEREYIQRFDPPWNLQGRKRGMVTL